ncbi:hypothetical protein V8G54_011414 [Vigna mungo]|uniref:Uncharacterized protein n=1 Tax=Vigna mungo TaxID=3915 RepID=A0AAQ3S299_VIGMU
MPSDFGYLIDRLSHRSPWLSPPRQPPLPRTTYDSLQLFIFISIYQGFILISNVSYFDFKFTVSRHRPLMNLLDKYPSVHKDAFVAPVPPFSAMFTLAQLPPFGMGVFSEVKPTVIMLFPNFVFND